MRRLIFKIIIPAVLIGLWMNMTYYPCVKDGQLDYVRFWLIAGCPFGIKALGGFFYPVGFSISEEVGILGLNIVIGGIVGGFVLIYKIIRIVIEIFAFFIFDVFGAFIPTVYVENSDYE